MDRLTIPISPALAGRTVRDILHTELCMTDGQISSAKFREDGILLSGCRVRITAVVQAGDILSVSIADRGRNTAVPSALSLSILWEDEYFAVLDKPAGISTHGAKGASVAGILACKWGDNIRFHPVNRLDVGTTGLMIAARDGYTHERLRRLLHTDAFVREYLAVAEGRFFAGSGSVTLPLSRRAGQGQRHTIDPDGLASRTDYAVAAEAGPRTLLCLRLFTGRTHQIRVHLSAIGHPLTGDPLYGTASPLIDRPALHSWRIRLQHPLTGETLVFTSPLPPDMANLLPSGPT